MSELKSLIDIRSMADYQIGPNEPIGKGSINRVISHLLENDEALKSAMKGMGISHSIQLWTQNTRYFPGDIVVYYSGDSSDFAFLLLCVSDSPQTPKYVVANGLPDFSSTGWKLIHPNMYYLHNDESLAKQILAPAISKGVLEHELDEDYHGGVVIEELEDFSKRFLKKDLSNFRSERILRNDGTKTNGYGKSVFSHSESSGDFIRIGSDDVLEMDLSFSFDEKANQDQIIANARYFLEKNSVKDKSDDCIFSSYYLEATQSLTLANGNTFYNIRVPGTNVFSTVIKFPRAFANTEYMVFQSSYSSGQFAFAANAGELTRMKEGTTDCFVGNILFTNKTSDSITAVLPVHTHFSPYGKYSIGVPFINKFHIHLVGQAS